MKKNLLYVASVAALGLAALGCGPKMPDGMPKLEPVLLTVTQDGANLPDAMVTLKSLDATNKFSSGGTTDANGVATLVTHGQYKGVPAGKYKVAVSKTIGEGTKPPPTPIDEESARVYQEYIDSGATYEEFTVVEQKFNVVETTPLEIEVVPGKNELTVDVSPAVHEKMNAGHGAAGAGGF